MILTKELNIKINSTNFKRLKDLGYIFEHNGDEITIKIEHISKMSSYKIDVLCEFCGKIKNIEYRNYINQTKDSYYICKDCKYKKISETIQKTYGVDNISKLEETKLKKIKTTLENYGVEHTFQCEININKRMDTFKRKYNVYHNSQMNSVKKSKRQFTDEELDDWKMYNRKCRRLLKINRKIIFEKWDGFDYYDGEYIKENLKLNGSHKLYPTIDHKISIFYGFKNNISAEEISDISNLFVTKRYINSIKNIKNNYIPNDKKL